MTTNLPSYNNARRQQQNVSLDDLTDNEDLRLQNLCTLDFMVGSRVEIERLEGFQSDIDTCHISDLLASVEATAQRSHENIRKIEMRTQLIILILITLVSSIPE